MHMDIAKSNIVKSIAGRDTGDLFFVLAAEGDFLLLADGKRRRVEQPSKTLLSITSVLMFIKRRLPRKSDAAKESRIVSFVEPLPQ